MKKGLSTISFALTCLLLLCLSAYQPSKTQAVSGQSGDDLSGAWKGKCRAVLDPDHEGEEYEWTLEVVRQPDGLYSLSGTVYDIKLRKIGPNEYAGEVRKEVNWIDRITVRIQNGQINYKFAEVIAPPNEHANESILEYVCTGYRVQPAAPGGHPPDTEQKAHGSALGYNDCLSASHYNPNDLPDESISSRYDEVKPFSEELAAVGRTPPGMRNAKWGYVDKSGRLVIDLHYDVVTPFFGGLAGVGNFVGQERSAKWGVINSRGIMLPAGQVYPTHDAVKILGEGFAAIGEISRNSRSAKWYIINAQGIRFLRLPLFDFVDCFAGGKSRVSYSDSAGNTHTGYVDTTGRFYEDPKRR